MRNSGCEVPEFMLKIKKTSKKHAKKLELNVPKRKSISTESFPEREERKRREKWKITKKNIGNSDEPPAKKSKLQPQPAKNPKTNLKQSPSKTPKFRPSSSSKSGKLHQPASQKHKVKNSTGKKSEKASAS